MAATLTGISTIRACKANERLALEFDNLQNVHSSVWQTLMSVNTGECCKKHLTMIWGNVKSEQTEKAMKVNKKKVYSFFTSLLSALVPFRSPFMMVSCVLDCSFGTLVGLCIVRLCGLRLLQLHRHAPRQHDKFQRRSGDFAVADPHRNGAVWHKTDDGVLPALHQHRASAPVHKARARAAHIEKANARLAVQRFDCEKRKS
jgi:hypothetical protein